MGAQMCAELTCRLFGRLCICTIVSKFGKLGTIATDFPDPTEEQLMMPTGVYSTLYTPNKHPVNSIVTGCFDLEQSGIQAALCVNAPLPLALHELYAHAREDADEDLILSVDAARVFQRFDHDGVVQIDMPRQSIH